jgi:glucose-6-phosphate 1-dehydrogenase
MAEGQISSPLPVIGFARRSWTDDTFRRHLRQSLKSAGIGPATIAAFWPRVSPGIRYLSSDFSVEGGYARLSRELSKLSGEGLSGGNVLFYLATPPSHYPTIVEKLGRFKLARGRSGWSRVVVEKPFGRDLASARDLNRRLARVFEEKQIFRIDHYLGKETVQNLQVFRFANGIFEPLWNQRYIDHVQITVSEPIGIEGRGKYFEEAGILRDMVQNHILQLVSLFAMEPPSSFSPEAVRNEKVKVLESLRPLDAAETAAGTVRGQYGHGLIDGREVPAYRQEPDVSPDSLVETFAAMKVHIDNWRWAGVPFYIRVGKRLPKRGTVINLQFRDVPHLLFKQAEGGLAPNVLTLRIQPEEGVSLQFSSKVPGPRMNIRPVKMDFQYGTSFGRAIPDAYDRLLLDCLAGDATLYTRRDEVEAAWTFVTGIIEAWKGTPPPPFPNYESGTWGPPEAEVLMRRDGRRWRSI